MESEVLKILSNLDDPGLASVLAFGTECYLDYDLGPYTVNHRDYYHEYNISDRDVLIDDVVRDWFDDSFESLSVYFCYRDRADEVMKR